MTDLYAEVVGQERAVHALQAAAPHPVHAYLLTGPPGTGKRAAARAFAAALLCADHGCGSCEVCRRVLAGSHPDVVMVERSGASILVDEAREIARLSVRSPTEGDRKVLLLTDFHLVEEAAPALLKTIEEPPESTVFVILADFVPRELVTIASRCCRIEFAPLEADRIAEILTAEGVPADRAAVVARAAGGRLDRARLLSTDPNALDRHEAWRAVPRRLDGTGATAAAIVEELLALADSVVEPVRQRQDEELQAIEERAKQYGEKPSGRKELDARFKREQRRARVDELRSGMATLGSVYRERMVEGSRPTDLDALRALDDAAAALIRNPNEVLLLQSLVVRLGRD